MSATNTDFGEQVVTVVSYTPTGNPDALGTRRMPASINDVPGCRHRPLRTPPPTETDDVGVSIAREWWQTTAPPAPAIMAAKAADVLRVDGETYQIIGGIQPFTDFSGQFKVTILSEKQTQGE